MRVSLEWLNECVDLSGLTPEEIAEALTNAGLEVESIERLGGQFSGVLVGKTEAVAPHPNADRLRLVTVDLGPLGKNQVVCGAPNVQAGMHIAYAQVGAQVLDRKTNQLFTLKPAEIRGVASTGMICSLDELGLQLEFSAPESGIWPLEALVTDAQLGQDLKIALSLAPDTVLDVSPNANRGDQMSMIGVAREVAALFKRPTRFDFPQGLPQAPESPYHVSLPDTGVCQYYGGAVLANLTIAPSPIWMQKRLQHAGIRAINNVVDITNYVMLEMGQPLHAFDRHRLGAQGEISVRYGRPGETIKTLDDAVRELTAQTTVVTFNDTPVAVAGVMGGHDSEITETTTEMLLEAAFFPPATVRRSARSVGLRTEGSARHERGIDIGACESALHRAIQLLIQHAGATLIGIGQADRRTMQTISLPLRLDRVTRMLGITIPDADIRQIFSALGFSTTAKALERQLEVQIPTFRAHDVTREIDLIEEIIRIHGYDAIPYTLPQETLVPERTPRARMLAQMRTALTGAGLTEITTLSLIGDGLLQWAGLLQEAQTTVRVTNSHSQEHAFLRQSLVPNLLETAHHNQDIGNSAAWLFELGKVYVKQKPADEKSSGVEEPMMLAGLLMQSPCQGIWHQAIDTDFYTLKGVVENLFAQLGLTQACRWLAEAPLPILHPGQTATLKLGKQSLGFVGQLHPAMQAQLKFKSPVYLFELNAEVLIQALQKQALETAVQALSQFPAVVRDLAFSAQLQVTHQQVLNTLSQVQEPLLKDVLLFDEYRGGQNIAVDTQTATRSLAYRLTLQSAERTLTDSDIDGAVLKLKQQLTQQLAVTFRE